MMGTSLLSVPWAIKQSGLIASIIIGFGMALVAMYTALLVIKIHAKYGKQPFYCSIEAEVKRVFVHFFIPEHIKHLHKTINFIKSCT